MSALPLNPLNRLPKIDVVSTVTPEVWYGPFTAVDNTAVASIADMAAAPVRSTSKQIIPVNSAGVLLRFAADSSVAAANETGIFLIERIKHMSAHPSMTVGGVAVAKDAVQFGSQVLGSVTVTLGTKTGVAAGVITAGMLYGDTMTLTTNRGYNGQMVLCPDPSLADDAPTELKIDAACCPYLRITKFGGTATATDPWWVGVQDISSL